MNWFDKGGFALAIGLGIMTAGAAIGGSHSWPVVVLVGVFWPVFALVGQYLTRDL
jgi:hypothetical protein